MTTNPQMTNPQAASNEQPSELSRHAGIMLELIKDYAKREGIFDSVSGLLIVREVAKPNEPDRPLNMVIIGEDATIAIQTLHYAGLILTKELRALTTSAINAGPRA